MAVDYFLKIDGIKGESHDKTHKDEIDLITWQWGEQQTGSMAAGGGGGAGKVSMMDFSFTMKVNNASPLLVLACATGEHFPKAMLTCRKAGKEQQEYLKIKFTDLLVTSYTTGGSQGGDEIPTDSISLNYTKMEYGYAPQKPDGTLDGMVWKGYDLKKMDKV